MKVRLVFLEILFTFVARQSPNADSSNEKSNKCKIARIAQLVEHDLAKVGVAGSNPVSRSKQEGA